jgi:peptidoglycan/LPS O-acetylase OafA/YrhL
MSNIYRSVSGRIPGLDGIRAIAVCAVVWHHSQPGIYNFPITRNGFLGVDAFFVLSGFLITNILLKEINRSGSISLTNFFARRALRIFPLYYFVLAILSMYFLFAGAKSEQGPVFLSELPYHLMYVSNWVDIKTMMSITWSLSTEEQFYILWPVLLVVAGSVAFYIILLLLLLNQAVNFGLLDAWLSSINLPYDKYEILQCTFTPIILGVISAYALRVIDQFCGHRARLIGFILILSIISSISLANAGDDIRGWPRLLFQFMISIMIICISKLPSNFIVRALEWRPLVHIGMVSYGIYLLHMIALDIVNRIAIRQSIDSPLLIFVGCLVLSVVLASVSFKYFELPILQQRYRFR